MSYRLIAANRRRERKRDLPTPIQVVGNMLDAAIQGARDQANGRCLVSYMAGSRQLEWDTAECVAYYLPDAEMWAAAYIAAWNNAAEVSDLASKRRDRKANRKLTRGLTFQEKQQLLPGVILPVPTSTAVLPPKAPLTLAPVQPVKHAYIPMKCGHCGMRLARCVCAKPLPQTYEEEYPTCHDNEQ